MKLLLLGKNGQLGFELQRALAPLGEVLAVGHAQCNVADPSALRSLVQSASPDVIVNATAYTAVDKAESDAQAAHAVNAIAPQVLAEAAAGALVVHYSTDYVFDGVKAGFYTENDQPNPQGVYGASKLAGEQALAASGTDHFVFRTSWVVGAHGGNFAKTMLRLAAERDALNVVADQHGAPTSAALLADCTAHAIQQSRGQGASGRPSGVYHLVAGGETTWHAYACYVIESARRAGLPIKVALDAIKPIPAASYPTPAKRPANSRLDTTKFRQTFGLHLPDWRGGVDHVLEQIL
jgi:dTDP-4-dehydrorhamnose reductase